MKIVDNCQAGIEQAVEVLRHGGVLAFPTETVYGLGADARNPNAVRRIFALKGRPANHPLIVHLSEASALERWAREIPSVAWRLAERFWPGPLTLILKRSPSVPDVVTGGHDTIGLRVPGHATALALLDSFGGALAAPSANKFGRLSPTSAADVVAELGDDIDCIIDGGPCQIGIESTILDISGVTPRILRPGVLGAAELAEILGQCPAGATTDSPQAPGRLPAHYAPRSPLRVVAADGLEAAIASLIGTGTAVTVLSRERPKGARADVRWQEMSADPAHYARELYARLRDADGTGGHSRDKVILVAAPPVSDDWGAIRDRLSRASTNANQGRVPR